MRALGTALGAGDYKDEKSMAPALSGGHSLVEESDEGAVSKANCFNNSDFCASREKRYLTLTLLVGPGWWEGGKWRWREWSGGSQVNVRGWPRSPGRRLSKHKGLIEAQPGALPPGTAGNRQHRNPGPQPVPWREEAMGIVSWLWTLTGQSLSLGALSPY